MIRIGIIFGGNSREREVSFAGGRTVYDNLNKSIFQPVPIFVDSFNRFVVLNWSNIYKGSIRDFYPHPDSIPRSAYDFQIYAEAIENGITEGGINKDLGYFVPAHELPDIIDMAFLVLHGENGEDGRMQGLLEFLGLPYTGSGIFASALGMNKRLQRRFQESSGFPVPKWVSVNRSQWLLGQEDLFEFAKSQVGFPLVVKPANQGSSLGVTILNHENREAFQEALDLAFFRKKLARETWQSWEEESQVRWVRAISDLRAGLGFPLVLSWEGNKITVYHPDHLMQLLREEWQQGILTLDAIHTESEVLIEAFIQGREFSCIVIEDLDGNPVALPPTEIIKRHDLFDYRAKYLPGLSRKQTPMLVDDEVLQQIRTSCQQLYQLSDFGVYARIDGFLSNDGTIYLNDPNTTSGMMPSSFFFHQAAEIGLNPSEFISYILFTSIKARLRERPGQTQFQMLSDKLFQALQGLKEGNAEKKRIAVILGGYSSERHISVESGRNIYEKLSASTDYAPFCVFLSKNEKGFALHKIPVNFQLKDNADDIRDKINHYQPHPLIEQIRKECAGITGMFSLNPLLVPEPINLQGLKEQVDAVFIALHGRPGEDGQLQTMLEAAGIPYNGSRPESSAITINKYETNEWLSKNGVKTAGHHLISKAQFHADTEACLQALTSRLSFPLIAKPVDDGCSSAVKKIRNAEELRAYCEVAFRDSDTFPEPWASILKLDPREEFPAKEEVLCEVFIEKGDAVHFLEVTGGMLTRYNEHGELVYEVFEASESLAEGEVLSLEEKFLAGEGQNITPARYAPDFVERNRISAIVKQELEKTARLLHVEGYCRIDAFVKVFQDGKVEVWIIEINSLPGMTPATCIFHQTAIQGYKPVDFISRILEFGQARLRLAK